MFKIDKALLVALLSLGTLCAAGPTAAAVRIEGQVQAGSGPLANSVVTLWGATAAEPRQLAQVRTSSDGRFQIGSDETIGADVILYLVAKGGDNPAAVLLAVLGDAPPSNVVISEMTTVASVWTNAQFLDGTAIKGPALGLKIAAGNVRTSLIFKPAAGAPPFRTRSIAARHRRWPTSRRWQTCCPVVPLG